MILFDLLEFNVKPFMQIQYQQQAQGPASVKLLILQYA